MTTSYSKNSLSLVTLIVEGLALFCLGLALTTNYWPNSNTSTSPGIIGALLLFLAICMSIVSAVMLTINLVRRKIDLKMIISILPFLSFSIWGIWYSYTDPGWRHNLPIYWSLMIIVDLILVFAVFSYIKSKRKTLP